MTAVPASASATVTVSKFDTSLPQGQILVEFVAGTNNGNNVAFTVGDLKFGYYYIIKREGADFTTKQANASGYIQFGNSAWPAAQTFTIEESSVPPPRGTIAGTVTRAAGPSIQGAAVSADGYSDTTNVSGKYSLSNVVVGNDYTVTASAAGYESASVENVEVEEGNTTTVNFQLTQAVSDTTPPAAVTNLAAGSPTSNTITLTWTAPGDDDKTGTASQYDIRYSTSAINAGNWTSAVKCSDEPAPQTAGSAETFAVMGLDPNTPYYFALKTADEVPLWSGISNCPGGRTKEEMELIAQWHFDEGDGTIAIDSSGNNNNATLINMNSAANWVDGKLGKGLNFDGNNDYLEIPSSSSLNSITSKITIMLWIKTDFSQRGTIIDNWYYDKTVSPQIGERAFAVMAQSGANAGEFQFGLDPQGDGSNSVWLDSNTLAVSNEWTHLAFVSDGANMSVYINGYPDAAAAGPSAIHPSGRPLHIGVWNSKGLEEPELNRYCKGIIDEVRIYSRDLSAEEVLSDSKKKVITTGIISGTARDNANEPLSGVTVSTKGYASTTNPLGGYSLTLSPGNYSVTASKNDYVPQTKPTVVTAGETTTLDFQLVCIGSSKAVMVYPNPYIGGKGNAVKIVFNNLPGESVLRIYTVSGKLVKTIKHNAAADGGLEEWDVSGIAGGVYIYSVISKAGKETGKVSIVK